jgi:hypothetical protein
MKRYLIASVILALILVSAFFYADNFKDGVDAYSRKGGMIAEKISGEESDIKAEAPLVKKGADSNQSSENQLVPRNFKIYINERYNYSILYPLDLLYPQGEAANGDGQKFLSKDGLVEMLVYGTLYQSGMEHERAVPFKEILKPCKTKNRP